MPCDVWKKSVWWRTGKYQATFIIGSSEKIDLINNTYTSELSSMEIEKLQKNLDTMAMDLRNDIF